MNMDVFLADSDAEIESCFTVFKVLRPHIELDGFLAQVKRQQTQAYRILGLRQNGTVKSAAGFRLAEFLAWGKILYIDDLTTLPGETGRGFAGALLDWLIEHARHNGCQAVHLDSGYMRHAAHRLYLQKGMHLSSHHLALEFSADA